MVQAGWASLQVQTRNLSCTRPWAVVDLQVLEGVVRWQWALGGCCVFLISHTEIFESICFVNSAFGRSKFQEPEKHQNLLRKTFVLSSTCDHFLHIGTKQSHATRYTDWTRNEAACTFPWTPAPNWASFLQVPVADLRTSHYDEGERMKLIGLCK